MNPSEQSKLKTIIQLSRLIDENIDYPDRLLTYAKEALLCSNFMLMQQHILSIEQWNKA